MPERLSCRIAAPDSQTMRKHDGVDRTGAGRGDAFKRDAIIFQQAIEHAPGKGAMAAAALKTQIKRLGLDLRRLGFGRIDSLVHKIAFCKQIEPCRPLFQYRGGAVSSSGLADR